MAEAALVAGDVDAGRELLSALDAAHFSVFAALWLMRSVEAGWTFCIGSTELESRGRHAAYAEVQRILTKAGTPLPLREITLLGSDEPLLQLLGTAINVSDGEIRFTNNVINGVLIPDALIFRMVRPGPKK